MLHFKKTWVIVSRVVDYIGWIRHEASIAFFIVNFPAELIAKACSPAHGTFATRAAPF